MKQIKTIFAIVLMLSILCGCSGYINWDNAEEKEATSSFTTIRIDLLPEYSEKADRIEVQSTLLNGMDLPVETSVNEYEIFNDEIGSYINCDLGYFGKHQLSVRYLKENETIGTQNIEYVLTANEYNIALLSATVPVTYFSLFMADGDNGYASEIGLDINSNLPTIIGIERAASYDWAKLLPNMTSCPFVENSMGGGNLEPYEYIQLMETFKQYIGYLHNLNPSSEFHLFINDFDSYCIPYLMLENGIGFDKFDVTAITDGTGTYGIFREKYGTGSNTDSSSEFYTDVNSTWQKVKKQAKEGSEYESILIEFSDIIPHIKRYMKDFMPVLINDPELQITWIMNRNNPDAFGTSEVYTDKIQNNENVKVVNMYNILGKLTEDEIKDFQDMYKFDSSVFEVADESGKGIMIFLGTATSDEVHFREYLTFMTEYYGDDYVYYYKAHPGYAADFDSSKAALLDEFGIISLDAAIPAELFYFFRNDAIMCGYQSSTFTNAEGVGISCIVNSAETYNGRADLTITADDNGTFQVTNIKDYPGSFTWDPSKPDVFPWLEQM